MGTGLYLDAIGEEKLLGDPISRRHPGDDDFSPTARPPLSDLEKELLQRGLKFYDQFAQQNAERHTKHRCDDAENAGFGKDDDKQLLARHAQAAQHADKVASLQH